MSKHMKFKWEVRVHAHKFQKIGYSVIIPFVYAGKEEKQKYMQYEVSVTAHVDMIAIQRKVAKWLPFKKYMSE